MALAQRHFTAAETDILHSLPEAERLQAFYALWTAKEAVLKAAGVGISYGLDQGRHGLARVGLGRQSICGCVGAGCGLAAPSPGAARTADWPYCMAWSGTIDSFDENG
ncbi:4'-phosphopantetheinyl transferase [mine drainage metagenome]|uniref:4'-phosphopantetheinyl transferase n=1 Tax=mine drainage metagenome TaxID=410659 RepID=T0ZVB5_9ZZZZ